MYWLDKEDFDDIDSEREESYFDSSIYETLELVHNKIKIYGLKVIMLNQHDPNNSFVWKIAKI